MIEIDQLIFAGIKENIFSEIEILFSKNDTILFHKGYSKSPFPKKGQVYDLASLTKPVATASSILLLNEKNELSLDDTLEKFFPELRNDPKKNLTLSQLLTHRSGLPAWKDLYSPNLDKDVALDGLLNISLENSPDTKMVYSCIGYLFLGEIVRRVSKMSLNAFSKKNIFEPAGMKDTTFNPLHSMNIVPTADCPLRKKRLKGVVHDENAFVFDREGGNAGLFSSAKDLHKFSKILLNNGVAEKERIFCSKSIDLMLNNQQPILSLPQRSFGWDINPENATYRSCGNLMPVGSIGHLGFAGTSIWLSPIDKIIIIILSNRVYYSREEKLKEMSIFRPKLHTLLLSKSTF